MNALLAYLASFLISPMLPSASGDWVFEPAWRAQDGYWEFVATSSSLSKDCDAYPQGFIELPLIVQGIHQIFLDGRLIAQTGDPQFKTAAQIFNVGVVSCAEITNGHEVKWKVRTITESLAKIVMFPIVKREKPVSELFFKTLNDASAVAIPLLGIICATMFFGKLELWIVLNFLASALLYGAFFALSDPQAFHVNATPFHVFRLADSLLWLATIFQMHFLSSLNLISKKTLTIHNVLVVLGLVCIAFAKNLDQSQVGSTIGMTSNIFILSCILVNAVLNIIKKNFSRLTILEVLFLSCFIFTGTNDILLSNGVETIQSFHLGVLGCMCFMALATNERILIIYKERDYLRSHLQDEVTRKTADLNSKSEELEKTLADLKTAQADLVHSAKLASLGTLSAGIAHEINNSLNYVKGSIQPLETLLSKDHLDEAEKGKVKRLLGLMKEGLALTLDIISNLKRHLGSSQNSNEVVGLHDSIKGTLLLLAAKLKSNIQVDVQVPEHLAVMVSRVSLSQIIMNLINNAADALEAKQGDKHITIKGEDKDGKIRLSIADNANGIPQKIMTRIFDPFFTTKDVGKGTGLGLHIVRQEVQKSGGDILVESKEGVGTTFELIFPKVQSGKVVA